MEPFREHGSLPNSPTQFPRISKNMTDPRHDIVLGTHNRKKGLELAQLLAPYGLELLTLADVEDPLQVVEDGETFAQNAELKACRQASHLRRWVLGEDSGLAVDALNGQPGVYSARYSGPRMRPMHPTTSTCCRHCARCPPLDERRIMCATSRSSDPEGSVRADAEACCHGRIAEAPRGTSGFGYDPLFEIIEYHRTFGELGEAVKSMLSHRGRAARKILPQIARLVHEGQLELTGRFSSPAPNNTARVSTRAVSEQHQKPKGGVSSKGLIAGRIVGGNRAARHDDRQWLDVEGYSVERSRTHA